MICSEKIDLLAGALTAFQNEIKDPARDADNPFFKSKYVTLDDLLRQVRPVLAKNGLSFIQMPGGDGKTITVKTVLMHVSGQYIETDALALQVAKVDPQGAGSAVTYGRRYALSAVLGVAWDDDDDGNKASGNGQAESDGAAKQPTSKRSDRGLMINTIVGIVKEKGLENQKVTELIHSNFNKPELKGLTDAELARMIAILKSA